MVEENFGICLILGGWELVVVDVMPDNYELS
jgi:hypothetical protein